MRIFRHVTPLNFVVQFLVRTEYDRSKNVGRLTYVYFIVTGTLQVIQPWRVWCSTAHSWQFWYNYWYTLLELLAFQSFHLLFFFCCNTANTELVLINFYADWCRFSNMLAPIFDEAADKVTSEFPSSRVILGKVDCDKDSMNITTF
jgi:thiol-disulfide isomerase/thioredoxin